MVATRGYISRIFPRQWAILDGQTRANVIQPASVPTTTNWLSSGRNSSFANNGGANAYALAWGAIFQKLGTTVDPDVLVKVRKSNYRLYVKTSGGLFLAKEIAVPAMPYYDATFAGNTSSAAPNYSGNSDYLISPMADSKFLHLLSQTGSDQYVIPDTAAVTGIVTVYEAKLISASGADLTSKIGTVLAQAGMDYRLTAGSLPAGDAFVSSLIPIQPYWQRFFGTTMRLPDLATLTIPDELQQLTDKSYVPGVDPDYVAP